MSRLEETYTPQGLEVRKRLLAAFRALRSQGIIAMPNFQDCSACALAILEGSMKSAPAAIGVVYWLQQDDEALRRQRFHPGALFWGVHVRFAGRTDGDDAVAIGKRLVAACEVLGLEVRWSGRADEAVLIKGVRGPEGATT